MKIQDVKLREARVKEFEAPAGLTRYAVRSVAGRDDKDTGQPHRQKMRLNRNPARKPYGTGGQRLKRFPHKGAITPVASVERDRLVRRKSFPMRIANLNPDSDIGASAWLWN